MVALQFNHNIIQQEKELFEQFHTKQRVEVKDCGYKDPDGMVRDRVVIGCYSKKVRQKLIQEGSELTLDKAVNIARTQEMSNSQLQRMALEENNVNSLREERENPNINIPGKIKETTTKTLEKIIDSSAVNVE